MLAGPNHTLKLANRVAIVTGGGHGIGKAIAITLAQHGAKVMICGRQKDLLDQAVREIEATGTEVAMSVTDVSDEAQVQALVSATLERFSTIDILINNAGVVGPTAPVTNVTRTDWDEVMAINLTGAFLCAKAVSPHLIQQRSGKIVNIASIAGKLAYALRSPYAASKWGMLGLSQTLALELGQYNIQVNAVCPGPTAGDRMYSVISKRAQELGLPVEDVEKLYVGSTALKRMVDPQHVAATVLFLASSDSDSITGEAWDVSAGYAL
jgi:NAD(P)-dependent dehydrogenase (short-subunit alcohol dehydrogenase family)